MYFGYNLHRFSSTVLGKAKQSNFIYIPLFQYKVIQGASHYYRNGKIKQESMKTFSNHSIKMMKGKNRQKQKQ